MIRGIWQELRLVWFVRRLEMRMKSFAPTLSPVERLVRFKYCLDRLSRKSLRQRSKGSFCVNFRGGPQQQYALDPVACAGIFLRAADGEIESEAALVDAKTMVGSNWRVYPALPSLDTISSLNEQPVGVGNYCGVVRVGPTHLHIVLEGKNRIRWFQIHNQAVRCRSTQLVFGQLVLARDLLGHWYLKTWSGQYEVIPFPFLMLPIIRSMPFRTRSARLWRIGIMARLITYKNMFSSFNKA